MHLPEDWPKHCTPFDKHASETFTAAEWKLKRGVFDGDKVDFMVHVPSGFRFIVCTKPWAGERWILATICDNPKRGKTTLMHETAQQAMRFYLHKSGSTPEREAAEAESYFTSPPPEKRGG